MLLQAQMWNKQPVKDTSQTAALFPVCYSDESTKGSFLV